MSEKVTVIVQKNSTLKRTAKAVLLVIASFADDDGQRAYPSVDTIAERSGFTRRAVQNAITAAVQAGELDRVPNSGPNAVNNYRVRLENLLPGDNPAPKDKGGARRARGAPDAHKDSSLRAKRSSSSLSDSDPESVSDSGGGGPAQSTPNRDRAPGRALTREDHRQRAEKNGYLSCPDCGRFGGGCHCGDYLNESFDRAMRDSLDAGLPGPAERASRDALAAAYGQTEVWFPSWQLTKDRTERIDSLTGKAVPLPPQPHWKELCRCAACRPQ